MLDISKDDFIEDYEVILAELKQFDKTMLDRPMIVVFNKADVLGEELVAEQIKQFKSKFPDVETLTISAVAHMGLKPLVAKLKQMVDSIQVTEVVQQVHTEHVTYQPQQEDPRLIRVEKIGTQSAVDKYTDEDYQAQVYQVFGKRLEQIVVMNDFNNHEAVARVYDVLKKMDVYPILRKQGIALGDIIRIGNEDLIYRGE